jgi:hypothetical protein
LSRSVIGHNQHSNPGGDNWQPSHPFSQTLSCQTPLFVFLLAQGQLQMTLFSQRLAQFGLSFARTPSGTTPPSSKKMGAGDRAKGMVYEL